MPKLEGIETKYWGKYKIDKENDRIIYSDLDHVYIDKSDNSSYISVTTLIGKYSQTFDEEFWSSYKALEKIIDPETFSILKRTLLSTKKFDNRILYKFNIDENLFLDTQNEIKSEYDLKRKESCERGTKIHANLENSFYNRTNFNFDKYGYMDLSGEFNCKKNYYKLDLDRGVYPEFLISLASKDGILKVAGQIDLLIKDGMDISIIDWKGLDVNTPILTNSGWKTMGTLSLKDKVFDKDGKLTDILHISEIHQNACYEIKFDNNDSFIADKDHRWLISFKKNNKNTEKIMTTEELFNYMNTSKKYGIPKIYNSKPLDIPNKKLEIDPYILGAWLGDGSKSCGIITNVRSEFWDEVKKRGYEISKNLSKDRAEEHTLYGLSTQLKKLNLLNNKHIPIEYLLSSYNQRLDLLRGLMDTDGYYNSKRKRFVMCSNQDWQIYDFASLISSLGWKPTIFEVEKHCNGKLFKAKDVCFTTNNINPFLIRNQENIDYPSTDKSSFRNIKCITLVKTVDTKCIEVNSPTHTYLAGRNLITTHNTNAEIKKESYYNRATKKREMMKYPLNNLMDTNYWHYTMQLSSYAYLLQQINPNFNIKGLKIVHFDHDNKQHNYDIEYRKDDVERMFKHYKKQLKIQKELDKNNPLTF